jgi:5-methylcytosine-specific restriction endonuclease McrA
VAASLAPVASPPCVLPSALVLNASHEPLCVVSGKRAVVLLLAGKAVCLVPGDREVHSASWHLPVAHVLCLTRYVRVPFRAQVPLSRRAVYERDGGRCAYCSTAASSVDHVMPRSRGGAHSWDNVVAACQRCNHLKADRTLKELGWSLRRPPTVPAGAGWRVLGSRTAHPTWRPYLALGLDEGLWETPA